MRELSVIKQHLVDRKTRVLERCKEPMPQVHRNWKIHELIPAIDRAIRRIDDGFGYGLCIECSDLIDDQRLLRIPETERCVVCQNELEQRQKWKKN